MRKLNSAIQNILVEQENKKSQEKRIGTYQTKYFYVCPGAQAAFPKIEKEIGGRAAAELAQLADNIFAIEAKVMEAGGTNDEAIQNAKNLYNTLMGAAQKAGVADELDFMKGHINIIENPTEDNKLKEARFNKNRTVVENICNNLINQSLNELHEARVDPAIRLGRAYDRQRKRREWLRGDLGDEGSVEAGPVVFPQTSAQQADFAAHEAERIAATRHSYDPNVRRIQRDVETPAGVTTRLGDAESTASDIHLMGMHDHMEDHGGVPLTPQNINMHGINFEHVKEEDKSYFDVNASKGPLKDHPLEVHEFTGPGGEEAHGVFSTRGRELGRLPYEPHPHFPGKRVLSGQMSDVIGNYGIPEEGVNESRIPKRNYTAQELQEAALNRIKMIGKTQKSYNAHPGQDRI